MVWGGGNEMVHRNRVRPGSHLLSETGSLIMCFMCICASLQHSSQSVPSLPHPTPHPGYRLLPSSFLYPGDINCHPWFDLFVPSSSQDLGHLTLQRLVWVNVLASFSPRDLNKQKESIVLCPRLTIWTKEVPEKVKPHFKQCVLLSCWH